MTRISISPPAKIYKSKTSLIILI